MICSVLIPSRARPDRLHYTIRSLHATAAPGRFEALLRFDEDDTMTLARREEFDKYPNTRIIIGPRLMGYASLNLFYDELAAAGQAPWVWIMNDDAWVQGTDWDIKLARVPTEGFIVQPENYQWGSALYPRAEGAAFPLVPNGIWRKFGESVVPYPADTQLDQLLRFQNGWKTQFLDGITVVHNRDSDDVLAEHRRL